MSENLRGCFAADRRRLAVTSEMLKEQTNRIFCRDERVEDNYSYRHSESSYTDIDGNGYDAILGNGVAEEMKALLESALHGGLSLVMTDVMMLLWQMTWADLRKKNELINKSDHLLKDRLEYKRMFENHLHENIQNQQLQNNETEHWAGLILQGMVKERSHTGGSEPLWLNELSPRWSVCSKCHTCNIFGHFDFLSVLGMWEMGPTMLNNQREARKNSGNQVVMTGLQPKVFAVGMQGQTLNPQTSEGVVPSLQPLCLCYKCTGAVRVFVSTEFNSLRVFDRSPNYDHVHPEECQVWSGVIIKKQFSTVKAEVVQVHQSWPYLKEAKILSHTAMLQRRVWDLFNAKMKSRNLCSMRETDLMDKTCKECNYTGGGQMDGISLRFISLLHPNNRHTGKGREDYFNFEDMLRACAIDFGKGLGYPFAISRVSSITFANHLRSSILGPELFKSRLRKFSNKQKDASHAVIRQKSYAA
ncbi:hypothetical protein Tco_1384712 [Tanacetum coccineum]